MVLETRALGIEIAMDVGLTETVCWEGPVQVEGRARYLDRARHCRPRESVAVAIALAVVVLVAAVAVAA